MAWRGMILFMFITCETEIVGVAISKNEAFNLGLYNTFLISEAGFTIAMYGYFLGNYVNSTKLIYGLVLILLFFYCLEINIHGILNFNDITTTIMSVMFIDLGLFYYLLLMRDDKYVKINVHPPFWWVAGTLFFYYGSTANDLFFAIFKDKKSELFTHRYTVIAISNVVQYGFWSYSFICRYYQRKLTP